MSQEPRTETGRAHLDEWWPNIPDGDDIEGYENIERQDARTAIRAIEDEAARKERERIEYRVAKELHPFVCGGVDVPGIPECVQRARLVVAITDTGEGSAS